MNKNFIDFKCLVKKPKYTYLVGSGSLFILVIDNGDQIRYKIEYSEKPGDFFEYFYKDVENQSCILIRLDNVAPTLPIFLALHNKIEDIENIVIKLFKSSNFPAFSKYKLKYNENKFKFTINPKTNELYAVIDVTI